MNQHPQSCFATAPIKLFAMFMRYPDPVPSYITIILPDVYHSHSRAFYSQMRGATSEGS